MATLKLTLDNRRTYADGRSPLILRLTAQGKSTSIHLGVKVFAQEWDAKKQRVLKRHPNQQELNLHLKNALLNHEQKLVETISSVPNIGLLALKASLTDDGQHDRIDFIQFALQQIESLKIKGRYGNAQSYQTATNKLVEYAGKQLLLSEIDYNMIQGFESHQFANGVGVNGIAAYMRAIRALLNIGVKMGAYDIACYPFNHFKIRTEKTISRAEPIETIRALSKLKLDSNDEQLHARNIFLLIFGLIGISFMDLVLLKKTSLKDGRIAYKRRKTGKLYSIKVTALVADILESYHDAHSEYLLPQFGLEGKPDSSIRHYVNLGLKTTNRYLKQLGESLGLVTSLTTYVARYSWANIAKSQDYSKDLIAEALGHSYGNAVTGIYLEGYGDEVIDKANARITALL